jgi:hypothetical protein
MLKFPKILPSWMYRDPLSVADELINKIERDERQAQRKRRVERNNKHLRIEALTRKAMSHA